MTDSRAAAIEAISTYPIDAVSVTPTTREVRPIKRHLLRSEREDIVDLVAEALLDEDRLAEIIAPTTPRRIEGGPDMQAARLAARAVRAAILETEND